MRSQAEHKSKSRFAPLEAEALRGAPFFFDLFLIKGRNAINLETLEKYSLLLGRRLKS